MWNEQKSILQSQLSGDERLLWSGQPQQGIIFRASDIYVIPFSLLWCGFAIFWETLVIIKRVHFLAIIWGIPFVMVGLNMLIGRFFLESKQRSKTYYGVTNERIIILSGVFSRQVKSLNIRNLTDISLDEKSDGTGTITFGAMNIMSKLPIAKFLPARGQQTLPSFDLIPDAKKVYEIIRNAQRQAV